MERLEYYYLLLSIGRISEVYINNETNFKPLEIICNINIENKLNICNHNFTKTFLANVG